MDEKYIESKKAEFITEIKSSIKDNLFVKISLGNYQGENPRLKKVLIKMVSLKGVDHLQFTYRYKIKDQAKNYSIEEGFDLLNGFLNTEFKVATLFTVEHDLIFTNLFEKKITIKRGEASHTEKQGKSHDHIKKRAINPRSKYLNLLGISSEEGKVYKSAQNKFKQINHFISLIEPRLKNLDKKGGLKIADVGCGKGYLSFALYDFLNHILSLNTSLMGVDVRDDLVSFCNQTAKECSYENLNFICSNIQDFEARNLDVLIALHACDTATDDAIFKGISSGAQLILTAPCCHRQIRQQIEKNKPTNDLNYLMKFGTFLERQAEMVTDGIRTLVLEYFGYKVKVLEFVSDEHTPKNVMIIAEKKSKINPDKLIEIKKAMTFFNIDSHHLIDQMKIDLS